MSKPYEWCFFLLMLHFLLPEQAFGQPIFEISDGRTVQVDKSYYVQFKKARVREAIRATQSIILWANRVRGL